MMDLTQRVELHDARIGEIRARWQPVGSDPLYDVMIGGEIVQRIEHDQIKRAIGEPRTDVIR